MGFGVHEFGPEFKQKSWPPRISTHLRPRTTSRNSNKKRNISTHPTKTHSFLEVFFASLHQTISPHRSFLHGRGRSSLHGSWILRSHLSPCGHLGFLAARSRRCFGYGGESKRRQWGGGGRSKIKSQGGSTGIEHAISVCGVLRVSVFDFLDWVCLDLSVDLWGFVGFVVCGCPFGFAAGGVQAWWLGGPRWACSVWWSACSNRALKVQLRPWAYSVWEKRPEVGRVSFFGFAFRCLFIFVVFVWSSAFGLHFFYWTSMFDSPVQESEARSFRCPWQRSIWQTFVTDPVVCPKASHGVCDTGFCGNT